MFFSLQQLQINHFRIIWDTKEAPLSMDGFARRRIYNGEKYVSIDLHKKAKNFGFIMKV